jgi:hypothetical protein
MIPSFFRIQQDLVDIIETSIENEPGVELAHELNERLLRIVQFAKRPSMQELIDVAVELSEWLDDGDIRKRDSVYASEKTERLKHWAIKNKFSQYQN